MTLRVAYALGLWATTTLALLAVLLGGSMPVVAWLGLLGPAVAGWRIARDAPPGSLVVGTVVTLAGLGAAVGIVIAGGLEASVMASAFAIVAALAGRLYSRRDPGHDLQALMLGLMLLFAGAGLHTQLTYGIVLAAFAVAAAWTLAVRQLWVVAERESERTGGAALAATLARRDLATSRLFAVTAGTAVAVLISTSFVFVAFPRVGLGTLGLLARRGQALPEGVSLTRPARALGGGEVLARVSGLGYDAYARGLYLRAATYDELTGAGFSRSARALRPSGIPLLASGDAVEYEVFLQPVSERALPALGPVRHVRVLAGGGHGPFERPAAVLWPSEGTAWATLPLDGPVRYRVRGRLASAADADRFLADRRQLGPPALDGLAAPYLALPPDLDPRIPALAARITGGARTAAEKARRLRDFLAEGFTYSLESTNPGAPDPLASFLFDDRRGHCEFFATAFATLLRASGVPARVAGGLAGGDWDAADEVVVFTASTAHVWTEWYQPGAGWVTDDATPVGQGGSRTLRGLAALLERVARAWDENVLEYGLDRQLALVRAVSHAFRGTGWPQGLSIPGRATAAGAAVVALVVGALALARAARRRRDPAGRLAAGIAAATERWTGCPVGETDTLRSAVGRLGRDAPDARELLGAALARYERARFGARPLSPPETRSWLRRLRRSRRG